MPAGFDFLIRGTDDDDLLSDDIHPSGSRVSIDGLGGSDLIHSFGTSNKIQGGAGNDEIHVAGGLVLDSGGDDFVISDDVTADLVIRKGAGDDQYSLELNAAVRGHLTIEDGAGDELSSSSPMAGASTL